MKDKKEKPKNNKGRNLGLDEREKMQTTNIKRLPVSFTLYSLHTKIQTYDCIYIMSLAGEQSKK